MLDNGFDQSRSAEDESIGGVMVVSPEDKTEMASNGGNDEVTILKYPKVPAGEFGSFQLRLNQEPIKYLDSFGEGVKKQMGFTFDERGNLVPVTRGDAYKRGLYAISLRLILPDDFTSHTRDNENIQVNIWYNGNSTRLSKPFGQRTVTSHSPKGAGSEIGETEYWDDYWIPRNGESEKILFVPNNLEVLSNLRASTRIRKAVESPKERGGEMTYGH